MRGYDQWKTEPDYDAAEEWATGIMDYMTPDEIKDKAVELELEPDSDGHYYDSLWHHFYNEYFNQD